MNLFARLKEIDARLAEIRKSSTDEMNVEKLTTFETECDKLQEERKMIEAKLSITSKTEMKPIMIESKSQNQEMLEKRGKDFIEGRTIKVSSDEVLLPTHTDTSLSPYPFLEASEIIDKVKVVNLMVERLILNHLLSQMVWQD